MMTIEQAISDLPAGGGQREMSVRGDANEPITHQPPDRHRDCWSRNLKPARQGDRLHGLPLAFRLGNGLEVIFLGDGDAQRQEIPTYSSSKVLPSNQKSR